MPGGERRRAPRPQKEEGFSAEEQAFFDEGDNKKKASTEENAAVTRMRARHGQEPTRAMRNIGMRTQRETLPEPEVTNVEQDSEMPTVKTEATLRMADFDPETPTVKEEQEEDSAAGSLAA
jgi:hypothetical protein